MSQWKLIDRGLDRGCTVLYSTWIDKEQVKSEAAIRLFVDSFEAHGFLEGYATGRSGRDKAKIPEEEHTLLEIDSASIRSSSRERI